jgi:hypothetical protein
MEIGNTMMCEQSGPKAPVRDVQHAERAGFDFGHLRPLLALARCPGPCPLRLECSRRRCAGHGPNRAYDLCHLPDQAVPPGGRGPKSGHRSALVRRAVHTRAGCRRKLR